MTSTPPSSALEPSGETAGSADQNKALLALQALMRDIAAARDGILRREALFEDLRNRLARELAPLEKQWLDARLETLRVLGRHLHEGGLRKRAAGLLRDALIALADELEEGFGIDLEKERGGLLDQEARPEKTAPMREKPQRIKPGGGGENQARKNPSTKAERKRAGEEEILSGDIRALYLLLARALHPDKESDPALREGKTAWMQKVTAAYGRRDLAELLDILGKNPLGALGPYLSRAPIKTVQGFTKRLRRELAALKAQGAAGGGLDPFFEQFLRGGAVNEPAVKMHLAETKKAIKHARQRLEIYRTREGVDMLVESLAQEDWRLFL